jgi:hypothetical protein
MGGLSDFCKEAKALSVTKLQSAARLVDTICKVFGSTLEFRRNASQKPPFLIHKDVSK